MYASLDLASSYLLLQERQLHPKEKPGTILDLAALRRWLLSIGHGHEI